jgi:hypothetical protein
MVLEILNFLATVGVGALGGFSIGFFFFLSLLACVIAAVVCATVLGGIYVYVERRNGLTPPPHYPPA